MGCKIHPPDHDDLSWDPSPLQLLSSPTIKPSLPLPPHVAVSRRLCLLTSSPIKALVAVIKAFVAVAPLVADDKTLVAVASSRRRFSSPLPPHIAVAPLVATVVSSHRRSSSRRRSFSDRFRFPPNPHRHI
nr:hypothetical protein CFP56_41950 [Quercus suber]